MSTFREPKSNLKNTFEKLILTPSVHQILDKTVKKLILVVEPYGPGMKAASYLVVTSNHHIVLNLRGSEQPRSG